MIKNKQTDIYPYAKGNRFEDRNTYFYTQYHGSIFFEAWQQSRLDSLARIKPDTLTLINSDENDKVLFDCNKNRSLKHFSTLLDNRQPVNTDELLDAILIEFTNKQDQKELKIWIDRLLKKYEISKRIHGNYISQKFLAVDKNDHKSIHLYLKLIYIMFLAYDRFSLLPYLNVSFKLLDTLCAMAERINPIYYQIFQILIQKEKKAFIDLATELGVVIE